MLRVATAAQEAVSAGTPLQPVLWAGRDAPPTLLRELLANCGYAMHDRCREDLPTRRVAWLAPATLQARDKYDLTQRRIGVVHPDPGAADALAETLRARGAQVIVLSLGEAGLERAEALDPDVVLVKPEHFAQDSRSVVAALWEHPWLCWSPILFVPAERLGIAGASAPDVRELAVGIQTLCADYELSLRRARRKEPFQLRLEQLGPVRTLRALLESQSSLRVSIETPQRTYELDLGEGLVIGASALPRANSHGDDLLGVHALKALLASTGGQVSIRSVAQPALTNIMAPLEALLLSERETPPLADIPARRESAPHARTDSVERSIPTAVPALFLRIPPDNSVDTPFAPASSESCEPISHADATDNEPTTIFSTPPVPAPADNYEVTLPGGVADAVPGLQPGLDARDSEPVARSDRRFDELREQLQRRGIRAVTVAGVVAVTAALAAALWLAFGAREPSPRPPSLPARGVLAAQSPKNEARPGAAQHADDRVADLRLDAAEEHPPASAEEEPLLPQQFGNEARREAADRASSLVRKGNKLRKRGRLRAAHDAYRDALGALPRFPRALAGLTEVALAQGDAKRALDRVGQLLQERHRFPDDQRLLGDVYMLAGRSDDAQAAFRRAARLGSSVARARLKAFAR